MPRGASGIVLIVAAKTEGEKAQSVHVETPRFDFQVLCEIYLLDVIRTLSAILISTS
jgi:hypothetical protein